MLRKWRSGAGLIFSLGLILAMIGTASFALGRGAVVRADAPIKVTLCHRDANANQPYGPKPIEVSINSVADAEAVSGHGDHDGPIFPAEGPDGKWGDIIPPFTYQAFSYPGKNWPAGQTIFDNGCIPKVGTSVTTLSSKTGNVTPGTSVTDTATVSNATGTVKPTGTVQFKLSFNGGVATNVGAPKTVSAGTATSDAISGATDTAAGEYCWQAFFYATGNFNNSSETAKTNECFTVVAETTKDGTSVTTQSSTTSNDVEAGTAVTDTATVTNTTGSATPTGSVQFKISFNGETTIVGATKTLDGTGHATSDAFSVTADTPYGEYCWQAFFTATGNFENSSETDKTNECFEVSGPYDPRTTTTTVVFNAATNAALVGNLPVNGSVYDTSTVKHLGGGTPTGTIAYTFYTNNSCSGDGTSAGSGLALGTKSSTMGPLAAGQYSFKASYTSNTEDFNSSTSDCEPFTVSPAQLNPTPSPSGGVLAATGATPPTQDLAIFLIALGLVAMAGGAFAWRRREA